MLIGLVGKPSSGKSTFFQAITSTVVERAAYPFTTIKPNRGVGYVEVECVDKEFNVQCNPRTGFCKNSRRFVPVELLDVAGLVPGAHEGKGLGNKFLDDLRQADILIHIVDASGSTNEKGEAVSPGSHDPCADIKFLEEELNYWIMDIFNRNLNKLIREQNTKKLEEILSEQFAGLQISKEAISKTLKTLGLEEQKIEEWSEDEKLSFCRKLREFGKKIIIAANKCDRPTAYENIKKMKEKYPEYFIMPCSAESEIALKEAAKKGFIEYIPGDQDFKVIRELNEQQKKAMEILEEVIKTYSGTGVQKLLNSAVFEFLHYIAIFPGGVNKLSDSKGNVLPDVFLMPPNSTALDFAFTLHTDMGKGFIKAVNVKTKQPVGKEYLLKNRDVIEIFFKK
ncbi:MAG: redox-regulated ATPase YchF [Candidatus ainarchaeum sp.]|nr:redox-regulated ATPase YchF [Candidatus ainarchaeum sp.]